MINKAWSFTGLVARRVVDLNRFGNLIVEAEDGRHWRIIPEELSCAVIADSADSFRQVADKDGFKADWQMNRLVEAATAALGAPGDGRCFCLKMPGVLGGEYSVANVGTIALEELIRFAGELARQTRDVPDGGKIRFRVTE